jgi:UDP-N-acetylmuramoyl-tripeptide--D-alanyl-D-alanine ligase
VAITGSVGKTTTRQIAYHVLSQRYRVFSAPKNFNNYIGLPLTLLGADPDDQIVITELGSNHPGEIAYLTRIAQPDIAVITNVHPAHLSGFGDLQTITQEKLSISEGLQGDGVLIINAGLVKWLNNQIRCPIPDIRKKTANGNRETGIEKRESRVEKASTEFSRMSHQIITFGKSGDSTYQAQNIDSTGFGSTFTVDGTEVYLPLPGPGNVENALAAWAICSQFGLTVKDFAGAVRTLPAIPMRAELLQIGRLLVLNDCYNANPASMKNALNILANLDPQRKRRLVFICGDMAELGQQTEALHAELGASIAQAKVQLLLAVGKFAKITAEAAKRNVEYDLQIECFEDIVSACNNLQEFIKDYDIILVKGSRAAKLEMAVEKLKELFS